MTILKALYLCVVIILVGGCATKCPLSHEVAQMIENYEKNMIERENCDNWYDGCNYCSNGGCTMMYCENYSEPKCVD